jgi:hypothetical protein
MRSILAFGLFITLCATTSAATLHRAKPHEGHLRTQQLVTIRPSQRATAPRHFAVPVWTDEQTDHWLYSASAPAGPAGLG